MEDQKVAPFDNVAPTPAAPTQTDLPVITDPAAYSGGDDPAAPRGATGAAPDALPAGAGETPGPEDDRAGIARLGDPVAVWPCAGCG
ncbi:hypothetical protein AB0K37_25920, partial [Actinomadura sp. NPDC049753]